MVYKIIKPIESDKVNERDILSGLLTELGCSVSSCPEDLECEPISDEWEYLNISKMSDEEINRLPDHWKELIPQLYDNAIDYNYAYVNVPDEIMVSYPRVPISGVCMVDGKVNPDEIVATDLIWIGDDIEI